MTKSLAQIRDERDQARRRKLARKPRKAFAHLDLVEFQRDVDAAWEPGTYLEMRRPGWHCIQLPKGATPIPVDIDGDPWRGSMRAHVPTRRLRSTNATAQRLRDELAADPGMILCSHDDRVHALGAGIFVCFGCWARLLLGPA